MRSWTPSSGRFGTTGAPPVSRSPVPRRHAWPAGRAPSPRLQHRGWHPHPHHRQCSARSALKSFERRLSGHARWHSLSFLCRVFMRIVLARVCVYVCVCVCVCACSCSWPLLSWERIIVAHDLLALAACTVTRPRWQNWKSLARRRPTSSFSRCPSCPTGTSHIVACTSWSPEAAIDVGPYLPPSPSPPPPSTPARSASGPSLRWESTGCHATRRCRRSATRHSHCGACSGVCSPPHPDPDDDGE